MNFEFEVDQFKTDPATGLTRIIIRYNLGNLPEVDERGFDCPEKATYYIDTMRRDWLSRMFNKYVKASRIIFERTPHMGYYNEQARLNSLQRCVNWRRYNCRKKIHKSSGQLHRILSKSTQTHTPASKQQQLRHR